MQIMRGSDSQGFTSQHGFFPRFVSLCIRAPVLLTTKRRGGAIRAFFFKITPRLPRGFAFFAGGKNLTKLDIQGGALSNAG